MTERRGNIQLSQPTVCQSVSQTKLAENKKRLYRKTKSRWKTLSKKERKKERRKEKREQIIDLLDCAWISCLDCSSLILATQ